MSREAHVQFCEGLAGQFRWSTLLIILVKSKRAGERVMQSITRFLTQKLKLTVNATKSKVAEISQCKFLGFVFIGKQIRWSESAFQEFKRRVRELTGRSWEYPRNIDFGNSPNISEDGRIILVFQSITGHCQILTDGFAEGYGCASGRCGANRKPKSRIY